MKRFSANVTCNECPATGTMQISARSEGQAKKLARHYKHRRKTGTGELEPGIAWIHDETEGLEVCGGQLQVTDLQESGALEGEDFEHVVSFVYDI